MFRCSGSLTKVRSKVSNQDSATSELALLAPRPEWKLFQLTKLLSANYLAMLVSRYANYTGWLKENG